MYKHTRTITVYFSPKTDFLYPGKNYMKMRSRKIWIIKENKVRKRERWSVSKGNGEDKQDNEIMMIEECIR